MTVRVPLFPGYIFVCFALRERLKVLEIPGVVRLVGFNGAPVPLQDRDIEILRSSSASGAVLQPHPFLAVGRRVRVKEGPLKGIEGILNRKKNINRVVLSIPLISRSASLEIDAAYLERVG
jgi:transcription antitermination factor NusG